MQSFNTESDDARNPPENEVALPVCEVTTLPGGYCRRVPLPDGNELAIFNVNGEYYATDNSCPHRGAALSEGIIDEHVVECGLHGWRFDVRTGQCLTVPEKLRTFRVKVEGGTVFVMLQAD
jgi:nitrite reductase/ring-hydroxylating ferredoxin subunit